MIEPEESLTLDDAALDRAAGALSEMFEYGYRPHWCSEHQSEDGDCELCWEFAAAVIRAAEGLRKCPACNGGGIVAPGDSCPDCGGNGLQPLDLAECEVEALPDVHRSVRRRRR